MTNILIQAAAHSYSGLSSYAALADSAAGEKALNALPFVFSVAAVLTILLIVFIAGAWKMYEKAGQSGWKVLIPIYNVVILCRICGVSAWWTLAFLIPYVNFAATIYLSYRLGKAFGKGGGFVFGLVLLPVVFQPILGFGKSVYQGNTPAQATPVTA